MNTCTLSDLQQEYRFSACGDSWGHCMAWLFAIADHQCHNGQPVPDHWQFRPSPFGPDTESPEYQTLQELEPPPEILAEFGAQLWRLRGILQARGLDY